MTGREWMKRERETNYLWQAGINPWVGLDPYMLRNQGRPGSQDSYLCSATTSFRMFRSWWTWNSLKTKEGRKRMVFSPQEPINRPGERAQHPIKPLHLMVKTTSKFKWFVCNNLLLSLVLIIMMMQNNNNNPNENSYYYYCYCCD